MLLHSKRNGNSVGSRVLNIAGGVDRTVAQLNVEHFRRLLIEETDAVKRRILHELLLEEEAKLASLDEPSASKDKMD